ncbi:MAG: DUF4838 domain-containing protein [Armatimonadota bacterium]
MIQLTLTAALICVAALTVPEPRLGTREPYPEMQPPFFDLATGGQARASIVTAPECTEVEDFAATELAEYLQQITGADFDRAAEPAGGSYPIYLGEAAREKLADVDFEALHEDGFVIRSSPDGVMIAGREDLGTLYGVYHLLEKYLGVRWFMPGELGTVASSDPNLAIGTIDEVQEPDFRVRWIESGDWALHNRMNVSVAVNDMPVGVNWLWGFHTHFKLVVPEEHFDEHPEYFALINGVRQSARSGQQGRQLCTSNPEVIELMAEAVCRKFDEDPTLDILALAPQDGGGFCTCPQCRALDEDRPEDQQWHAQYSNRLARFNNEVARRVRERHPDRLIKVGAYAMYMRVPEDPDYRPEPNLIIQACHTYSCNNHRVAPPTCERNWEHFTKELNHWAELTDHLFIYEYYNKGAWGGLPYPQTHVIRWDIPYFKDLGVEGFYTQAAGNRFPIIGLNHYIASKLVWDAELDVDLLLQDFYDRFYEEAAEPMGRYWERLEDAFADNPNHLSPFGLEWTTLAAPRFFTPEVLSDLDEAVTEAEGLAQSEPVRQRVHQCRVAVEFTRMVMEYLTRMQEQFAGVDRDDEEAVQAAYERAVEIGEPISERIVQYCRDNGLPVFDRLVRAHNTRRFIMPRAEDETLLR